MSTNTHTPSRWPVAAYWAAEALAGAALGFILAAAAGFGGARAFAGSNSGFGDLIAAVLGMLAGYTIGAALGVYLAARLLGRRGSLWPALAGSVAAAALVLLLAEPLRLNANTALLQAVFAIALPICATLALNLRRRPAP